MSTLVLALLGALSGGVIEGIAASYAAAGTFWPWRAPVAWTRVRIIGCALVSLAVVLAYRMIAGPEWGRSLALALSLAQLFVLATLACIDLATRFIPSVLVALLLPLALAAATTPEGVGLERAIIGAVLAYAVFAALIVMGRLVFGKGALGLGDANLALAVGCMTGYPRVVDALLVAVLLGGVGTLGLLCVGWSRRAAIPYGPCIALGAVLTMTPGVSALLGR